MTPLGLWPATEGSGPGPEGRWHASDLPGRSPHLPLRSGVSQGLGAAATVTPAPADPDHSTDTDDAKEPGSDALLQRFNVKRLDAESQPGRPVHLSLNVISEPIHFRLPFG